MSLNRTLSRLFDEVRREARRNPRFADRLDAILRAHSSNRGDIPLPAEDEESAPEAPSLKPAPSDAVSVPAEPAEAPARPADTFNPIAVFTREGRDGLRARLLGEEFPLSALAELVAEHHLDPAGVTAGLDRAALIEHVIGQAAKRVERDRRLFDY